MRHRWPALQPDTGRTVREGEPSGGARPPEPAGQGTAVETLGIVAGGIAHDVNNLLTAICIQAELALEGLPDNEPARDHLEQLVSYVERAAGLTRQLLASGRRPAQRPEAVDIGAFVAGTEPVIRRLLEPDVELVTDTDWRPGRACIDRNQLEQVLLNLVLNARDAMPHGGVLCIETANVGLDPATAHHLGDFAEEQIMLAVGDTGTGMDAATQARIFEPFFSTKEPGRGTGLGLATVREIVEQAGGSVSVSSEPGGGSTFRVFLPRLGAGEGQVPVGREAVAVA